MIVFVYLFIIENTKRVSTYTLDIVSVYECICRAQAQIQSRTTAQQLLTLAHRRLHINYIKFVHLKLNLLQIKMQLEQKR